VLGGGLYVWLKSGSSNLFEYNHRVSQFEEVGYYAREICSGLIISMGTQGSPRRNRNQRNAGKLHPGTNTVLKASERSKMN